MVLPCHGDRAAMKTNTQTKETKNINLGLFICSASSRRQDILVSGEKKTHHTEQREWHVTNCVKNKQDINILG